MMMNGIKISDEGCGGDPNAESGCAGYCGNTCTTYNWTDQQRRMYCPHICIKGCNCKSGYVYDDNVEECVLLEDCIKKMTVSAKEFGMFIKYQMV
ncbi:hypothetical protein EVAR_36049_1 [Eumeta japonica]|uniref:TIL domain-containing protein n=1 Tax=Eumeta variegata TaxID=151549 RepID=A0A4C1WTM1_EUMVA|nr:hypothetical protein EVAR_36049_1 [Eumeta japonica]